MSLGIEVTYILYLFCEAAASQNKVPSILNFKENVFEITGLFPVEPLEFHLQLTLSLEIITASMISTSEYIYFFSDIQPGLDSEFILD
jgi:hypothetical protein